MIALTDAVRKGSFAAYCAPNAANRPIGAVTGSLAESQYSPFSANRLPRWIARNNALRWPGSFGFGFLSPQPPGIVGTGPNAEIPHWANVSWSFFFLGRALILFRHSDARAQTTVR